jgi:hypothetical protein
MLNSQVGATIARIAYEQNPRSSPSSPPPLLRWQLAALWLRCLVSELAPDVPEPVSALSQSRCFARNRRRGRLADVRRNRRDTEEGRLKPTFRFRKQTNISSSFEALGQAQRFILRRAVKPKTLRSADRMKHRDRHHFGAKARKRGGRFAIRRWRLSDR